MEECACFVCFDCDLLGGDWSKTITFVSVCVLALDGKRKGYPNSHEGCGGKSVFAEKKKDGQWLRYKEKVENKNKARS